MIADSGRAAIDIWSCAMVRATGWPHDALTPVTPPFGETLVLLPEGAEAIFASLQPPFHENRVYLWSAGRGSTGLALGLIPARIHTRHPYSCGKKG
ncbi:hypothetical protein [Rhizobium sp. Root482]|uniref:hypothetical protein n=1 Tax=Rhizobium sp. Root482 TaxID=1736543 RepID=UPI0006F30265|nr:hypothetical protein [Rhizobium sp. Root482]